MLNYYYTIWKKSGDSAELLDEPTYYFRFCAFRRARKLAKKLIRGSGDVILVRKISIGDEYCFEWEFSPEME